MVEDIGEFANAQEKLVQWGIPFELLFKSRFALFLATFFFSHYALTFRYLSDSKQVLDVGCGMGLPIKCLRRLGLSANFVGVDIYAPYLKKVKKSGYYYDCVVADINYLPFKDNSFSSVMCLQVLEHLSRADGVLALKALSKIARIVTLTTPVGYIENDLDHSNAFQDHKSGWYPEDLRKLGFKVMGYGGIGVGTIATFKPLMVFTVVFAPLILYCPKMAFHLFAVKASGNRMEIISE